MVSLMSAPSFVRSPTCIAVTLTDRYGADLVSQAPPPSDNPSVWRQIQKAADANPLVTAIVAYTVVTIAAIIAGYFAIFTYFASYDDEGTLLVTLNAFIHGDVLYREIWSVYGPFYYEVFGAFFKITGQSVTTDAGRTLVVLIWTASSLVIGLAAHKLTDRLWIGITAMATGFTVLTVLDNEPMHPQGLCALLLAGFTLVAACSGGRRNTLAGAGCGALLAAVLLTKVNLGVFAIAGTVLTVFLIVEPLHRRTWLRWLVVLAYLAIPTVVMARDLDQAWAREFIIIEFLAATAVIIASRPLWPRRGDEDGGTLDWVVAGAVGFVVLFVACTVAILLTGPSLEDLYDGMIKGAFGIRDVLSSPLGFPAGATIDWAIGAVAVAAVATHLRTRGGARPSPWPGLLRVGAGLAILFGVSHIVPIGFNPSSQNGIIIPMLLAWVVAIPPFGVSESPHKRLVRVLLPVSAVALTMQVYPVPGSQIGIASVSFIPIGALCLGDGLTDLRTWSTARGTVPLRNFLSGATALAVAVPAVFGINAMLLPGINNVLTYRNATQLALPGADLVRISAPQAEQYEALVGLLHEHHCSTFVGFPTVNSLYLWSELEPPKPTLPNAWVYGLNESQQAMALRELKASPHPCMIKDEELAVGYLKNEPPPDKPLVNYVLNDFRPIDTVGPFEFEVPKPDATS